MDRDFDSHPSEGRLVAYLDGELARDRRASLSRHLVECPGCARRLEELRAASEEFSTGLSRLEATEPHTTAGDLLRLGEEGSGRDSGGRAADRDGEPSVFRRSTAARIAASVAVLLGAAAALPGSPVRSWIGRSVEQVQALLGAADEQRGVERPERSRPAATDRSGVAVSASEGSIRIRLTRVPDGTTVLVRLVAGSRAGVWNAGGEYRTGPGEIEVVAPDAETVLVEIPRSVPSVRLEVNGQTVVEGRDGDLETRVPGTDLRDGEFRFRPRGGTQ